MTETKMTVKVCKYYNTGYCKYANRCKFKHPKTNCPKASCSNKSCQNRHPKPCRYKDQCRRKTSCLYRHSKEEKDSKVEIEELTKKVGCLKIEVDLLQEEITKKKEVIMATEESTRKDIEKLIRKVEKLENESSEKDNVIKSLKEKV